MSKFASLAKGVKDLLQKPYSYDNKVELKTKAANGTTFASDASISGGKGKANLNVTGKHGSFSVDKLTVGTEKKVVGEFSFTEAAPAVDLSFKFTDGSHAAGAKTTASVGATYTNATYGTYTVDVDALDGPNFEFTDLIKYKGVLVGGSAKVTTSLLGDGAKAPAFGDLSALLGYQTDDFTFFAQSLNCTSLDLGLTHTASSSLTAGFLATLPFKDTAKALTLTLGGSYKLDSDTTLSATADHLANVSFAYKAKLSPTATVTACAQVAAADMASDKHKFGLTLNLTN